VRAAIHHVYLVIEPYVFAVHVVKDGWVQQRVIKSRVEHLAIFLSSSWNAHPVQSAVPCSPALSPDCFHTAVADFLFYIRDGVGNAHEWDPNSQVDSPNRGPEADIPTHMPASRCGFLWHHAHFIERSKGFRRFQDFYREIDPVLNLVAA
jgi:hypothetical protein